MIGKFGEEIVPCQYREVRFTDAPDEYFLLKDDDGLWGFFDFKGFEIALDCYEEVIDEYAVGGGIMVKSGGLWGYLGQEGDFLEEIVPCIYATPEEAKKEAVDYYNDLY